MDINYKGFIKMLNRSLIIVTVIFFSLCYPTGVKAGSLTKGDSLSLDKSIRHGRLPNGFSYFIKSVPGPESKTYLRLLNRAGGNQEDHDQWDLAHAVEHLAFKATEQFPFGIRNDKRFTSLDMNMYDATAVNGHKFTKYIFDAPRGDVEALEVAFLWFKEIIGGLKLSEQDINQVRGELRQETISRNGKNLNELTTEIYLKSLLFPCVRSVSNLFDHLKTFEPTSLRRFYHDWYNPDIMALIVVGNINDIDKMESLIIESFSDLRNTGSRRNAKDCNADYFNDPPRFFKVERLRDTSRILQNNRVDIRMFFRDPETYNTLSSIEGSKRLIQMQLLIPLINKRFRTASNQYHNLSLGGRHLHELKALPPAVEIHIGSQSGKEKEALSEATSILNQIQKYGFMETEWEQMKQERLQYLAELDEEDAEYWISEIEKHYIDGEALPSKKLKDLKEWLENYTSTQFNEFAEEFLKDEPEDVVVVTPAIAPSSLTEKEVRHWIKDGLRKVVEPYKPIEPLSVLISNEEVEELEKVGYEEKPSGPSGARYFELSNGVKVLLKSYKPASGSKSGIKLHAFSLEGANCFPEDYYNSAVNAPGIVKHSGVNGLDEFEIKTFLTNTSIRPGSIFPYIVAEESGIQGEADLKDFEAMLQLVYLYFTKPNKDRAAFEEWKLLEKEWYRNPSYNLARADLQNSIREYFGDTPSTSVMGKKILDGTKRFESVQRTDLDKAHEVYEKLFQNAQDFTFLISGDLQEGAVLPLIRKYLGNLPNTTDATTCSSTSENATEVRPKPNKLVQLPAPDYYTMNTVSYGIRFIENAENPHDWKEQLRVEALAGITNQKAWKLRHQKGFSLYMIGVGGDFNEDMNRYEIGSTFDCVPEEFPLIRKEFKKIISEIKAGEISEEEFQQGLQYLYSINSAKRANLPREMEPKLYRHFRYNQPWTDPEEVEDFIRSLTIDDIVRSARKYYKKNNFYEFVMRDKD